MSSYNDPPMFPVLHHNRPLIHSWSLVPISNLSLSASTVLAIADLTTVCQRTVIAGGASWFDVLVLAPGLHKQQAADSLDHSSALALSTELGLNEAIEVNSGGEEVSSCVINNVALVQYLKRMWTHNPELRVINLVVKHADDAPSSGRMNALRMDMDKMCQVLYFCSPVLTVAAIVLHVLLSEWWGVGFTLALIVSRILNVWVIKQRTKPPVPDGLSSRRVTAAPADDRLRRRQAYRSHGLDDDQQRLRDSSKEGSLSRQRLGSADAARPGSPDREASRLTEYTIDLTTNRRVVLRGLEADIQAVTTRGWMRPKTDFEGWLEAISKLIVYLIASLTGNLSQAGSLVFVVMLLISAGLLALSNAHAKCLKMHGRRVERLMVNGAKSVQYDGVSAAEAGHGSSTTS